MRNAIQIGRLFGVRIFIDWSWLLIFLLVTWNLTLLFGQVQPEWNFWLQLAMGVLASLLFFASVLAHELAHALVAQAQGLPVRSITLWLFGGIANIQREPPSPAAEFWIAVVGPITSFVLGILFILGSGAGLTIPAESVTDPAALLAQLGPLTTMMLWLGSINILLAFFNLVPGFPLDGGRILRSILWAVTNNLRRATRWASYVGQGIAWLMILTGIAMVFGVEVPIFGTGLVSGLWLAFIGWFLNTAAVQSYQQLVVQDLLEGVPVGRIMFRDPPVVTSRMTISDLVYDSVMGTDAHAFPVVDDGRLAGIICLHDVRAVPRSEWDRRTVAETMTPGNELVTVRPEDEVSEALTLMQQNEVGQLPVVEGNRLVGLLRRSNIVRWLELQSQMEREEPMVSRDRVRPDPVPGG